MKSKKINVSNILFFVFIILLIIPQTRTPIQVWLHKGISLIKQSTIIEKSERQRVDNTNWRLITTDNQELDFQTIQGKVIFINFWATWCPPCIAEMPSIQELYSDYKEQVVFLFITNDDIEKIETFMVNHNYNFEIYRPLNSPPSQLSTRSIPRTFIINKKGEIVVDETGAVNWNSEKVREQLDRLILE